MVTLRKIIIDAFLCIVVSNAIWPTWADQNPSSSPGVEDLQDKYYTVIPAMTNQFVPQDEADAKAISDSKFGKAVIAGIFAHREKIRRYAINVKLAVYMKNKSPYFTDNYQPMIGQNPFNDCCFSLIEKESTVLGNFLKAFMEQGDQKRLGIGMVLIKDRHDMITTFDSHFTKKFDSYRMDLKKPFDILVKNWAQQNREPLKANQFNPDNVSKDANALNAEHNNGGWKSTRTQLDSILFLKSIDYTRTVIATFEGLNNNKPIEDIISSYGLDDDLTSIYLAFVRYIKIKQKFIAEILLQYSNGSDSWAVWNMCLAVIHPPEWYEIDEFFKQINKGTSLTKFITEKNGDKVMAEMMAMIIDPWFKPTQF